MSVIHGVNYGTPTLDLNFAKNKSLIDTTSGRNLVTFTRAQTAREATYVGADGLIKSAVANEARFDHNPVTGECLGLLVEEQRTNSLLQSSDLTEAGWTLSGFARTANSTTAPDGTNTAIKIASTTGTFGFLERSGVSSPAGVVTYTWYAKAAESNWFCIADIQFGTFIAYFNLATGELGTLWAGISHSITPAGNGWYRCSVTGTNTNLSSRWGCFTAISNGYTLTPAPIGNGVHVWGPQLEAGAFPTSYIPTAGSTVTRSADQASITGTNFSSWYNSSEGTAYIDVISKGISNGLPYQTYFSFNSSAGDRWGIGHQNGTSGAYPSNSVIPYVGTGGAFSNTLNGTFSAGQKISIGMHQPNGTNIQSSRDGGSIQTVSTSRNPLITNLLLGGQISDNSGLMGTLKRITYYPTRLQDFQLQQLTK